MRSRCRFPFSSGSDCRVVEKSEIESERFSVVRSPPVMDIHYKRTHVKAVKESTVARHSQTQAGAPKVFLPSRAISYTAELKEP